MAQLGSFALLLALALSAYAFWAGLMSLLRPRINPMLGETARRAGIAVFGAVTVAAIALVVATFQNDFSLSYVAAHSNRDLHPAYKFSALWSGQEGSLLFWSWVLSGYALVLLLRHKVDTRLVAHAGVIVMATQLFFLLLINLAANPFAVLANPPQDGNGLNPLLQYPEMVIHPPLLYLGYVGFTIPFAFALGALIMKYPGEKWIHITRRWTMVTWLFLTIGVVLGMHWAYSVLGWGGYWGWDPVENASLLPWLTATAFLHSVMMQEKRGMMKVWNIWLIFATFFLCIFGTFLTRSGIVSSVHAFAQSSIGSWFGWFMALIGAVCIYFFILNRSHLKSENKLESLVSRESSFLFNNLVLLVSCFTVLWGTLFPILSEWVKGTKITVGPPFFNRVNVPIGLFLLFLTAVGPLLAWRSTSWDSIKRNFTWPAVFALLVAAGLLIGGVRPWVDSAHFYSLMAFTLGALCAATIASEFWRGARVIAGKSGQNIAAAMVTLTRRNTRRYGGYIVHLAVVLVVVGFAGSAFNIEKEQEFSYGDRMVIGNYELVCRTYTQEDTPNYVTELAILDVYKNGQQIATMYPESRFYKASEQRTTIVANRSTLREDLYLIYAGRNPDTGRPIVKAFVNPLVVWIWIGMHVWVFGTLLALVPNSKPKSYATAPATQQAESAAAKKEAVEVGD